MTNKKFSFLLLFSTLTFALIRTAYCVDEDQTWNLMDLDDQVASALGVSTFISGLIISTILNFMFLLPLAYLCSGKNKNPVLPCLIIGLPLDGTCVALGWLPVWIMLIICMLVALMFASSMRGWILGGSRGD